MISIISAIFPPARGRLELLVEVAPTFAPQVASGATAAAGLLMLNLSGGLRRRKRRAWQVGVAVSASLVVLHLGKGVDVEETCLAATALTVLLMTQRAFIGRADPRARRQILVVSVGGATICASAGAAVVLSNLNDVIGQVTPTDVLRHIGLGLLGLPGPLQFVSAATDLKVATTLVLLGATIALLALATALRPASAPKAIDASDSALVRDLLARAGTQDSMAYFALRDDKCLMVAPSGRAAIAYRVVSGVSLASGDPVGEHESWGEAIDAWLEQARDHAWTPAVLGTTERGALAYRRSGFDAFEFGDEAVVNVAGFSLDGRDMRAVRQAVTRMTQRGYLVDVARIRDLSGGELALLTEQADRWTAGKVERGFSMALGRLGDPRDLDVVVVRSTDETGSLKGLLTLVPWGADALSLDVRRRCPQAENGTFELMIASLIAWASKNGVDRVSLNCAVFRAVFERGGRLGAGPFLRLWYRVLIIASRYWKLESQYRATAKYLPAWQPRFLCFTTAGDLPRIGAASLRAEAFGSVSFR